MSFVFHNKETSYNHLLHPTPSAVSQELQTIHMKTSGGYSTYDNKEVDAESTIGNEQTNLTLPNHQQLQRNNLSW